MYVKYFSIIVFVLGFLYASNNVEIIETYYLKHQWYAFFYQFLHVELIHFLVNIILYAYIIHKYRKLKFFSILNVFICSNVLITFFSFYYYQEIYLIGASGMFLALLFYSQCMYEKIDYKELLFILLYSMIPSVSFFAHSIGIITGITLGTISRKVKINYKNSTSL